MITLGPDIHGERIRAQEARGEFAWWPPEAEAAWRAKNPSRPEAPVINGFEVEVVPNSHAPGCRPNDEYGTWEKSIECGKSYMVGDDVPTERFLETHTTRMSGWEPLAWKWAGAYPYWKLRITSPRREWHVYTRGDHVIFCLPFHGQGGENTYISFDGKTKVHVNED